MAQPSPSSPGTSLQIREKHNNGISPTIEQTLDLGVNYYLLANSIVFALGWLLVLLMTLAHLFTSTVDPPTSKFARLFTFQRTPKPLHAPPHWLPPSLHMAFRQACTTYSNRSIGPIVKYMQTGMLSQVPLAIRNRSVFSAMQIIGRTYIVWRVVESFPTTQSNPAYAVMVLTWSGSEVTRHVFDALGLVGKDIGTSVYLRYAILGVLYPLAALSEAALIFSTLPDLSPSSGKWTTYDVVRGLWFITSKWSVYELVRGAVFVAGKRSSYELVREGVSAIGKLSPYDMIRAGLFVLGKLTTSELLHGAFFVIWWPGLYMAYVYVVVWRRKATKDGKPRLTTKSRLVVVGEHKLK